MVSGSAGCFIGPTPRIKIPGVEGFTVFFGPNLQHTVVFIGFEDSSAPTGMQCSGTGFLMKHDGGSYLITARHVAEPIGNDPFVIRVNENGRATLLRSDQAEWEFHPDTSVDLAAIPLGLPGAKFDARYVAETDVLRTMEALDREGIGVGSFTYTVGLFRYIYGQEQSLPFVHSGNIALMPPHGERIPVWDKLRGKTEFVEGYLIESGAIDGASGSPVFARPTISWGPINLDRGEKAYAALPQAKMFLLGLFQGAWFAPPDRPLAESVQAKQGAIVPVGVGIVVPAYKIIELLETQRMREDRAKRRPPNAAITTAVALKPSADSSTDENPTHREDFMRLASAAARKQKQDE